MQITMLQCSDRTNVFATIQYLRLEDDATGVFGSHGDVVVLGLYVKVVVGWHGGVVITCGCHGACLGDMDGAVDRASDGACGDS